MNAAYRMTSAPASGAELAALAALTFNWTHALDDVWSPVSHHVEGLHDAAAELLSRGIDEAAAGAGKPLGVVLQGERGVGKTHLLGWARDQVQRRGGYFFLVGDPSARAFWEEVLGTIVEQLLPLADGSRDQLAALLTALADRVGLDGEGPLRAAATGQVPPSPDAVKVFVAALRRTDPGLGLVCQDTARALVLLASPLQEDQDIGYYFLTGSDVDVGDRRRWGISSRRKVPRMLVNELSRLLALTGPTVLAIDQVDALIDELVGTAERNAGQSRPLADMATGLMTLRDVTRRTLTVLSCLPESWSCLREYGVDTFTDRFRAARQLQNIPSAGVGRQLIGKRFAADYARAGFAPPYPTWPVHPAAFDDASLFTARALLKRVESHVTECLLAGSVTELGRLGDEPDAGGARRRPPAAPRAAPGAAARALDRDGTRDLTELDDLFARLRDGADVCAALSPDTEDAALPPLLAAGLESWLRELGDDTGHAFVQDPPPGRNPRLHASLRMILDPRTERQRRWAFRAIAADHPRAVQSRLKKAAEGAGLDAGSPDRGLFVLRNAPWPSGPVTGQALAEVTARGGVVLPVTVADLAAFHALGALAAGHHPGLTAWLRSRQPAHRTELLSRALTAGGLAAIPPVNGPAGAGPAGVGDRPEPAAAAPAIGLGVSIAGREPIALDLAALRRHVTVFAGSGSGKTVLLRRIIEECALLGVSSIVLDPDNDLARLGDAWPAPPAGWDPADARRAAAYLENTDVAIWTPCRNAGRPLAFRPLPDFAAVRGNPDEFDIAVKAAVEALAPRVNADRDSVRSKRDKAVLTEALAFYARRGGRNLEGFIALLAELPFGASILAGAPLIAADLAGRLQAVGINDPLFAGAGQPADPGTLLTPPPGKRARVSVISMIGLPGLEHRQSFVNQLQMALFSWISQHPARGRPLGGLLVMDEAQDFAPSGRNTACTASTIRLASQARKYGLGLIFATQAPRALHNAIPGNSTTQFFGLLSSPAQIDAARDLARAKGGDVPGIGRLSAGEFYLAAEGAAIRLLRTPVCLSHHPASPLTEEEVLRRAARQEE